MPLGALEQAVMSNTRHYKGPAVPPAAAKQESAMDALLDSFGEIFDSGAEKMDSGEHIRALAKEMCQPALQGQPYIQRKRIAGSPEESLYLGTRAAAEGCPSYGNARLTGRRRGPAMVVLTGGVQAA